VDIWLEARHKIQRRKNKKKKNQPHIQPHLHRVLRRPQVPLKLKTARRLWSMALMMLQASFHQKPPRATEIHRQSPPVPTTNSSWECLGLVPRYPWIFKAEEVELEDEDGDGDSEQPEAGCRMSCKLAQLIYFNTNLTLIVPAPHFISLHFTALHSQCVLHHSYERNAAQT